jgi:3-hydroxypropionate dehydrogenase (NADP+)
LNNSDVSEVISNIKTTTNIKEAVSTADYVQESVFENYDVKKTVFKKIDSNAPKHTIIASSTSGLLMSEIQKAANRPERCVSVHPNLPTHLIPLVEIVGGDKTSKEAINTTYELMIRVGKDPVILKKEIPGFIINRFNAAILREAIDLVDKGIASVQDIDNAFCKGIGLRDPFIGPLIRIHLAGNGVDKFLKNYAQSYRYRWESMETWTTIPPSAVKKVVNGVNEMDIVRTKTIEEINKWRDEKLIKILKILRTE